jgi:hypothetical protein
MKYFEHLPYRLSRTCKLKKFLRNAGWSRDRNEGKALERTREYDNEACSAPSLYSQLPIFLSTYTPNEVQGVSMAEKSIR